MKTIYSLIAKIFIFAVLVALPCMNSYGQDVLVLKTGEEIKGKVTEILDMDIKYQKADNPTGPVYSIKKSEVVLIIFANGKKEVITVPNAQNVQNVTVVTQPVQTQKVNPAVTSGRIARARGGSILNYILIVPILGLGTAAVAIDDDESAIIGGVATAIGAIGIPIASAIAGNQMKAAGVKGSVALRIIGWISYGLFIADAVSLIAVSEEVEEPAATAIPAIALGLISTTFLGIDKSMKAMQGKRMLGTASLQPTIGYVRNFNGNRNLTMGFRINF